jgi:uncharacterized protein
VKSAENYNFLNYQYLFGEEAMKISMYQITVPVFVRFLKNLSAILKKGEAFAKARKIDPEVLLNSRLAPDMFPLSRQIQIACDLAKRCVERLAGLDVVSVEDNEKTFAEFHDRINNTIAFLETIKPKQLDDTEGKMITLKLRDASHKFKGINMALYFSLPNVYFHVTTAYNILRHNGVGLGKKDFIGNLPV